jgi:hypothetical protein
MKPNYDAMSRSELRAYILQHRDDVEAIEIFFARRSPDSEAVIFPPAKTEEEWQQQMETLRPILEHQQKPDD